MSKLSESASEELAEASMDMSPMIDMVFLLLFFFMVASQAVTVKTDPKVTIPIADRSKPAEDANGRIVVNIRADGTFTDEDLNVLATDDDITDYVRKRSESMIAVNPQLKPKLLIRGDKATIVRNSKRVIKASGISDVIFSAFPQAF